MKPTEIREMTDDELLSKEEDLERTVFNLRIQHSTGQLDNTSKLRSARRDVARVKTTIKERNLRAVSPTQDKASQ
jgi:large subunit ribosomal protein L29